MTAHDGDEREKRLRCTSCGAYVDRDQLVAGDGHTRYEYIEDTGYPVPCGPVETEP